MAARPLIDNYGCVDLLGNTWGSVTCFEPILETGGWGVSTTGGGTYGGNHSGGGTATTVTTATTGAGGTQTTTATQSADTMPPTPRDPGQIVIYEQTGLAGWISDNPVLFLGGVAALAWLLSRK